MSFATVSEPFILTRGDGSTLELKRCSYADWIAFRYTFRAYRIRLHALAHRAQGLEGAAAEAAMNRVIARPLDDAAVIPWLDEPEGQRESLLMSLRRDNPAATMDAVDALGLTPAEQLRAAVGVWPHLTLGPADPLPRGAASPETTSPTPPESPTGSTLPTP